MRQNEGWILKFREVLKQAVYNLQKRTNDDRKFQSNRHLSALSRSMTIKYDSLLKSWRIYKEFLFILIIFNTDVKICSRLIRD